MKNILTIILILITNILISGNTDSAMFYFNLGKLDIAQEKLMSLSKLETNNDTLAKCYHYLGNINYQKGDFVKSLNFFKKAEGLYTILGNTKKVTNELNNIGLIYSQIGELDKAKYYIKRALDKRLNSNDTKGINSSYTNLFSIENSRGNYIDAELYANESIKWSIKLKDTVELSKGYSNLGVVYENTNRYNESLDLFNKSLNICKDSTIIAICYNNIGYLYFRLNKYDESDKYFNLSIKIFKRQESFNYLKDTYNQIHEFKSSIGDYKSSLENYKLFISIRDSLIGSDNTTMISKMITDYDNKFKTKDREVLITSLELKEENSKQKIMFLFIVSIITLISVILITFGFYKSHKNYKQKKKLSDDLSITNKELGDRNKDITDSIQYAKRLQNGIIGDTKSFEKSIGLESNLLYFPKDIVSGDFYWSYVKDGNKYIAIGDCTGHGVPGSMISIVGHTSLTKIVEDKFTSPGDILTQLDKVVKSSFSGGSDIKDGMDITIIKIDKDNNIQFAGANNFMYLRRGNEFEVVKGDKFAIGTGDSTFTTKDIDREGVSHIYMLTDGIIDQFGGEKGKKLKQTGLKSMITDSVSFNDVVSSVNRWKNGFDQTDDITFLEIKL